MTPSGTRHFSPRDEAAAGGSAVPREHRIARLTECEVVPRLVLAGRAATAPPPPGVVAGEVSAGEVDQLVDRLLGPDEAEVLAFVRALHDRGVSLPTLYAGLLVPAARRLGQWWETDGCLFAAVAVGTWRLEQVLRDFACEFEQTEAGCVRGRSLLLAACPGETHVFAVALVAQHFRRAGWEVRDEPGATQMQLCQRVREQWFDVVGLSLACDARVEQLASVVLALRRASRNRSLRILVGGRVFSDHPDWVSRVGADATGRDAAHAVEQAEALLALLSASAA